MAKEDLRHRYTSMMICDFPCEKGTSGIFHDFGKTNSFEKKNSKV